MPNTPAFNLDFVDEPFSLKIPPPVRRKVTTRRRMTASGLGSAAEIIGRIEPGQQISGLTNGQFSLIDIIEHVLSEVGPACLTISTWTMGIYDQQRAIAFYRNNLISRIRWIIDPSIFSRRPEIAGSLVEAFGVDAYRAVNTHAKWATIRGDRLAVTIRSSMNLNPNKRLENFDLSESHELCAFFEAIVDDVFSRYAPAGRTQSHQFFSDVLSRYEAINKAEADASPFGAFASCLTY